MTRTELEEKYPHLYNKLLQRAQDMKAEVLSTFEDFTLYEECRVGTLTEAQVNNEVESALYEWDC